MTDAMLTRRVGAPSAWTGSDIAADGGWVRYLSAEVLAAIDAGLAGLKARGNRLKINGLHW
jgi:hypothetical protein